MPARFYAVASPPSLRNAWACAMSSEDENGITIDLLQNITLSNAASTDSFTESHAGLVLEVQTFSQILPKVTLRRAAVLVASERVIIERDPSAPPFTLIKAEGYSGWSKVELTLERITLRGGSATPEDGGGLWLQMARVNIRQSVISGNRGASAGGIHLSLGTEMSISDTMLVDNIGTGSNQGASQGGGIYAEGAVSVQVSGVVSFHGNVPPQACPSGSHWDGGFTDASTSQRGSSRLSCGACDATLPSCDQGGAGACPSSSQSAYSVASPTQLRNAWACARNAPNTVFTIDLTANVSDISLCK